MDLFYEGAEVYEKACNRSRVACIRIARFNYAAFQREFGDVFDTCSSEISFDVTFHRYDFAQVTGVAHQVQFRTSVCSV